MTKHTCDYTRDELVNLLARAAFDIMRLQTQRDTAMTELRMIRQNIGNQQNVTKWLTGIFRHGPRGVRGETVAVKPPRVVREVRESDYNPDLSLNTRYPAMIRKPKRPEQL